MNPLRIAVLEIRSGDIRAGPIDDSSGCTFGRLHNVLSIVNKVFEPGLARTVADAIPVVRLVVSQKPGNRSLQVTVINDHYHIIDEVVHIKQNRETWISSTVRIKSLHLKIECRSLRDRSAGQIIGKLP